VVDIKRWVKEKEKQFEWRKCGKARGEVKEGEKREVGERRKEYKGYLKSKNRGGGQG